MQRRHFLVSSIGALGASSLVFADSPSDSLRVAVIGMGGKDPKKGLGRGGAHLSGWSGPRKEVQDAEIVAICDIDDAQLAKGLSTLEGYGVKKPETYKDIRKVIENKDIDVLSIATPNHWHTLMTIWGCQAGKDVYVEKPCSHNIFEAKQIVAAARKYDRIVQQGSQIRSSEAVAGSGAEDARRPDRRYLHVARPVLQMARHHRPHASVKPCPPAWITTCGPVQRPKHPFTQNRFHYNWHWFWDTGNGDLGNQGIHEVDIARWGLGVKYPDQGRPPSAATSCSTTIRKPPTR